MDEQQKQTVLDLPKVIAVGIASPAGDALTSRFGVAGTLLGLALSAVIITVVTDVLKVYLARVPGAVTSIPGGFRKKSALQRFVDRIRLPFSKFSSLSPARRRSVLIGSVIAGGISFLVGLIIVTGVELGVGKNLSCWIWSECPAEASTDGGKGASTRPSIFGGGQSASSSSTPQVQPFNSQRQSAPGAPESPPAQTPDGSGSETPEWPSPGQQWSPSGLPEDQQRSPSDYSKDKQPESQGSIPPVRTERVGG